MPDSIVMIHGMWCGPWVWDNYKRFFEERGYRCITPVLPFHDVAPGADPDPRLGATGILDYASALEEEIRKQKTPPILMGHSMGGLLAQILGSRGLGKALVLLTPASPRGILAIKPSVLKSFWGVLTKWGFWKRPQRLSFEAAVYAVMHLLPTEEQKLVYEKLVYESGRAAFEIGFWLLDPNRATKVYESKITRPVLVVAGAQDRITPASVVRKVADKYPFVVTYKEFPNHAHWVLGEPGWGQIAEYVAQWLSKVVSN